jgi:hypothetical protein
MFSLADSSSRIKRLYIYSWYGTAGKNGGFDAGLANAAGKPRAGLLRRLRAPPRQEELPVQAGQELTCRAVRPRGAVHRGA